MQEISSRRFLRRLRVRFRPLGDPEPKTGYTTNISQTGMFVATIRPLKPGTEVDVEVSNKERSLRLGGVVVHARRVAPVWQKIRPSGMGVRFHEPAERADDLRQLMNVPASLH